MSKTTRIISYLPGTGIFLSLVVAFLLVGCQETVDVSNRYVFKDNTILDYLKKHPETYSQYVELLYQVPMSKVSQTNVAQILSARGNYTVFAPTNEAVQAYLDTLAAKNVIDEGCWEGFRDSTTLDSIRKVIVYNSIIDGGDALTKEDKSWEIWSDDED
jgi:uncharacterized protein YneF (UPF0154 family)